MIRSREPQGYGKEETMNALAMYSAADLLRGRRGHAELVEALDELRKSGRGRKKKRPAKRGAKRGAKRRPSATSILKLMAPTKRKPGRPRKRPVGRPRKRHSADSALDMIINGAFDSSSRSRRHAALPVWYSTDETKKKRTRKRKKTTKGGCPKEVKPLLVKICKQAREMGKQEAEAKSQEQLEKLMKKFGYGRFVEPPYSGL